MHASETKCSTWSSNYNGSKSNRSWFCHLSSSAVFPRGALVQNFLWSMRFLLHNYHLLSSSVLDPQTNPRKGWHILAVRCQHANANSISFCYYFARGSSCEVLWRVCLCVCVSVCPRGYLRKHTGDLYQIFCACCLCPWLSPPPACWR